jgi:TRAP-type C4-dicarboxylate transport system permease small subunit
MTRFPRALRKSLYRVEDLILAIALFALVLLAAAQILLRVVFDAGFLWLEPMLRTLVLWVAMLGAMVAAREGRHIGLGVVEKFLPARVVRVLHFIAYLFAAVVATLLAWHSFRMVIDEYELGGIAFGVVPGWLAQAVLPFAFSVIALRFLIGAFLPPASRSAVEPALGADA